MMPKKGVDSVIDVAIVAFAFVFFVVGCLRVVEFRAAGVRGRALAAMVPLHVLGCAAFSVAMALVALDPAGKQKLLMKASFVAAVSILFPIHIYVALIRRVGSPRG